MQNLFLVGHMLKINYSREEATLFIENPTNEEHIVLTLYYSDRENVGEFGGSLKLRPNGSIVWDDLIHFRFPIEVHILAMNNMYLRNYTFKETSLNKAFTLTEVKEQPLEEIIKWVFEDPYDLHPPINQYLRENHLMKVFFDLIYAYIDTEYDNKQIYGQYLQSSHSIVLGDSEQSNVILAKCVALMELLTLDKDEMAKLLLKVFCP